MSGSIYRWLRQTTNKCVFNLLVYKDAKTSLWLDTLRKFSAIFDKGNNFSDFLLSQAQGVPYKKGSNLEILSF